jgi:hypothetical protein
LVPGVGAQGGNLDDVCKFGLNEHIGLLINSSRGIIYASNSEDFAFQSAIKAKELQKQMETILCESSKFSLKIILELSISKMDSKVSCEFIWVSEYEIILPTLQ